MTFFFLLAIGLFLWFKEKTKLHESRAVAEEEKNNNVRPLSNAEIENQYFNMKTDLYLKKNYPTMISWQWAKGSADCLHYTCPSNRINLIHRDGTNEFVLVWTKDIWFGGNAASKKNNEQPDKDVQTPASKLYENMDEKITEYLKEHASNIDARVKSAMDKGCGFFVNYEVAKELATEEFMKKLTEHLEKNTDYDVSYKDNLLEINFQDALM